MKKIKRNLTIVLAIIMVIGMQSTIVLATEENTTFEENITIDGVDGDEAAIDNKAAEAQNSAESEEGTENVEPTAEIAAQSAAETYENGYVGDDVYGSNYVGDDVYGGNGDVILASGVCGDNLTWTFSDDGTLTISGTGPMWDYDRTEKRYPTWDSEQQWIKRVVIEEGVTSVGNSAFSSYGILREVIFPDSVTKIGNDAFIFCYGLGDVRLPKGLTHIGESAFFDCNSFTEITIPQSVVSIEVDGFGNCGAHGSSHRVFYFEGNAPEFGERIFWNIKANVYYPASNPTWTADKLQNYAGTLTWIPWNLYIEEEVTDSVYVKGSSNGATIKCTEELGKFISVAVDGVVVDSSNYTVVEGSTVLTFLSSYLDTLSVGDHVVTLNYTYGSVDTTLTVLEYGTNLNVPDGANGTSTPNNIGNANGGGSMGDANANFTNGAPKTGDVTSLWMLWMCCLSVGVGILAFSMKKRFVA